MLEPLLQRKELGSSYARFALQCLANRTFDTGDLSGAEQLIHAAAEASRNYPSDLQLQSRVLDAYKMSALTLSDYGDPELAVRAAHEGLLLGRRLLTIESGNSQNRWAIAELLIFASSAERDLGDYAAARRDADEALAIAETVLRTSPMDTNSRRLMLAVRRHRARNAVADGRGAAEAFAELDAGIALSKPDEKLSSVMKDVLGLRIIQWLYTLDSRPALVALASQEVRRLVQNLELNDHSAKFVEWKAAAAYLQGAIAEGDQLLLARPQRAHPPLSSDLREIRGAMCKRRLLAGHVACPATPRWTAQEAH